MAICTACGEENPDRFRLCGFCGTPRRCPAEVTVLRGECLSHGEGITWLKAAGGAGAVAHRHG
jgi:hypothetical protein